VIRPVRYEPVYATGGGRARSFPGTSQAAVESELSFRVSGSLRKVAVKVGDEIEAGGLVAELDPRDYELRVEAAEAALRNAEAQARNTARNLTRVRALYENGNVSIGDLDAARAASESAAAMLRSSQNQLEQAQTQLGYTRLLSPTGGSIASVSVDANENVSAGRPVAVLTSECELEVKVAMPGQLIADIREGDAATVSFDVVPGRSFPARVTEVGVSPTGMATTFPVTVKLSEATPSCRPGMAGEVTFHLGARGTRERVLVPPKVVGQDRQGRFVFVVERTSEGLGVVRRRPVTAELSGNDIEILEGLSDGELVVTAGMSQIHDGQEVRLMATK